MMFYSSMRFALLLLGVLLAPQTVYSASTQPPTTLFHKEHFTQDDAVLVTDQKGRIVYQWQPNKAMIPASLSKLVTAHLAIQKWGLEHRFHTDFYLDGQTLWVKGYGDPYLVSEELELIASQLRALTEVSLIKQIRIDASFFTQEVTPGSSSVADPYNAPLSAVAANFNTVKLSKQGNIVNSAEVQTPLTPTAQRMAVFLSKKANKSERVNLRNTRNAQRHFGELLAIKLGLSVVDNQEGMIVINQSLPSALSQPLYRHYNSHTLDDVLRGTLEFSNNFIANQVFLQLSEANPVNFQQASNAAEQTLIQDFAWSGHVLQEGSGLSRSNRLTALQINDVLNRLIAHKRLLKQSPNPHATVHAKTGTLNGVRSLAGYIEFADRQYQFVFLFNRTVAWRYREQLLERLVVELKQS